MRFLGSIVALWFGLACSGLATTDATPPSPNSAEAAEQENEVLHEIQVGEARLRWVGMAPPEGTPRSYGVEALELVQGGRRLVFRPGGTLNFSDWSFDVLSPDGRWVVLLQDRHGPYHAVRVEHLAAYFAGEREPDRVIAYEGKGAFRPVFEKQHWTAPHTFHYTEGSETPTEKTVVMPDE